MTANPVRVEADFDVAPEALATFDVDASLIAGSVRVLGDRTVPLYLPAEAFGRLRRSVAVQRAFLDVIENGADALAASVEGLETIRSGSCYSARSYTADDHGVAARYLRIPDA